MLLRLTCRPGRSALCHSLVEGGLLGGLGSTPVLPESCVDGTLRLLFK